MAYGVHSKGPRTPRPEARKVSRSSYEQLIAGVRSTREREAGRGGAFRVVGACSGDGGLVVGRLMFGGSGSDGVVCLLGGVGFIVAAGDVEALADASVRFSAVADGFEGHAATVVGTAGSLASVWAGTAAVAYQDFSGAVGAHFMSAAGAARVVARALGRYQVDLDRCQRDGLVAVGEAERCLGEIGWETGRLAAAGAAGSAALTALSAASVDAGVARAAGPLGVVAAAAADVAASAARAALSAAQADEGAATRALSRAQEELSVWQARGRRAWEDAQTAASVAGGALEGVMVAAPPVAGVAAFAPLVASAPFERLPGEEECGAAGEPDGEPASPGGGLLLRYALRGEPHWTESFPGREPTPGDGLLGDPVPENPPLREGMTGREPTLGDGLISDPAQQPCGRQQVAGASAENPVKTRWGWTGSPAYRGAVGEVGAGGTIESLRGIVPTQAEAERLIMDGGGTVKRVEGPHEPPNPHQYPHINYTTHAGERGTVQIDASPDGND